MACTVGVTGSRNWDDPATILRAMQAAQGPREGWEMVLHHGMCPPRRPSGDSVSWHSARVMPYQGQLALHGADWLCDVHGRNLGWRVKRWPADWRAEPRRAGFIRNEVMVNGAGAGLWLAFIMACQEWRCRRREPHGSHGATDCLARVRRAGIPCEVFKRGW